MHVDSMAPSVPTDVSLCGLDNPFGPAVDLLQEPTAVIRLERARGERYAAGPHRRVPLLVSLSGSPLDDAARSLWSLPRLQLRLGCGHQFLRSGMPSRCANETTLDEQEMIEHGTRKVCAAGGREG